MYSKVLLSIIIAALSIHSVHGRDCKDKRIIETTQHTVPSGNTITIERFTCSRNETEPAQPELSDNNIKRQFYSVAPRSASQCTQSACLCGGTCVVLSGCTPGPNPIHPIDCTNLIADLQFMSPPTFIIPPGEGLGFFFQSCEYTVDATPTNIPIEYCFSDMAVAAQALFNACRTQQGACQGSLNGLGWFVGQAAF